MIGVSPRVPAQRHFTLLSGISRMFIHDTHLPQVLSAEAYCCPDFAKREQTALFESAWHFGAVTTDLPKNGSFVTTKLLGRPVVLWRMDDEYHAFLNICPHRYAQVIPQASGCGQRLACQYHGWEFDCSGSTRKIPDAPSFRPLENGTLGLTRLQVQQCGKLLFVNFDPEASSLENQLESGFELGERLFSDDYELIWAPAIVLEMNWKIPTEITLESYHIDTVHPKTFGTYADAKFCKHEFSPNSTIYNEQFDAGKNWLAKVGESVYRVIGYEGDNIYKHYHCYPHILLGEMAIYSWLQTMTPISPTQCLMTGRFFRYRGTKRNPLAWSMGKVVDAFGWRFFRRILNEDFGVSTSVQQSMNSPQRPDGGLISVREERIFHFQRYIVERMKESDSIDDSGDGLEPTRSLEV